jgi:hypothetical protein
VTPTGDASLRIGYCARLTSSAWTQWIRGDHAAEKMGYEIGIPLTTIRWSERVLYLLIRDSNRCL